MQKFIAKIRKIIKYLKKSTSSEIFELAIIKCVLIELSKICSRDDRFFLFKENLAIRRKIYNKKLTLKKRNIKVSCKSYNLLIKDILKELGINIKLFSLGKDEFKHYGIIYENKNNKYYIDPLHDLINLKIGAQTEYFGIKYKAVEDLTVINKEKQQEINNVINYDDSRYSEFLSTISKNESVCDLIRKIQTHCPMTSVADFIIYLNKIMDDIDFSNKNQIVVSYCITLNKIKTETNSIIKKNVEGVYIRNNAETYYYFPSTNQITIKKYSRNAIYEKSKYKLKTYSYLKEKNGDRQILDNIFFQKLLYESEKQFNITERDLEVDDKYICIKPLNIYLFIYKKKFLAMNHNSRSFYFVVKNFGQLVYKKEIRLLKSFMKEFKI
mgnify:CR=1 FL=1